MFGLFGREVCARCAAFGSEALVDPVSTVNALIATSTVDIPIVRTCMLIVLLSFAFTGDV
jgi:hypothetical protein